VGKAVAEVEQSGIAWTDGFSRAGSREIASLAGAVETGGGVGSGDGTDILAGSGGGRSGNRSGAEAERYPLCSGPLPGRRKGTFGEMVPAAEASRP
jgi:hypothetical protein